MKRQHVVMTAGISVFQGRNPGLRWAEAELAGHVEAVFPPRAQGAVALRRAAEVPLPAPCAPGQVSAEVSMLHALRVAGLLADGARVDLVHTGTFAGELAAILVSRLIERDLGLTVTRHRVADLDAADPDAMRGSLGRFMSTVAQLLRTGDPRSSCFAPLGGYKVMTSLGYVTGAMLGFETMYVHEVGQRLVRVPAVPVDLDARRLAAARPPLWRVWRDSAPVEALSAEERVALDEAPWLFEVELVDGVAYVSAGPIARFLVGDPLGRALQREVLLSSAAARQRGAGLTSAVEQLLEELAGPHRDAVLFHERDYRKLGATFHIFRPSGGGVRLAWRLVEPHRLQVREAWLEDHARYEREVERGEVLGPWDGPWQVL